MRGAGHENVLIVLQVPGNKAGAVPCERLLNFYCLAHPALLPILYTFQYLPE